MTNYAADHIPDWSRRPNAERLDQLIGWVQETTRPITVKNFRRWLVELAYEHEDSAACSNGHDHACNLGLGEWLGIEPYGQGKDGSIPWNRQEGFSSERLNRYVDPMWATTIVSVPLAVQKVMYVDLLTTLRDRGEYSYRVPAEAEIAYEKSA